ncbi:3-dehydroquinate synthase [Viridibacillus sp. FSL R5-0477]|uniref:3-dehydroquinate synthase n=1 Tax=Viridibacillus arenosi FSL R5-213 TaxID=1227360 RepID=W4EKQ2_9BACL|nr:MULTISPECIES: 3-dehydroquinate synthase [Viridibacillus]ETT81145.1 3-dehydroquinate synthase [Viridibacillus arenosi FSL R5-213]OMC84091.1 3-dehydroquinate synthase [Viridibacillus sp. FSL H8-0123]OMC88613.1 3-dehydroquinate synthase [Viridibacillus sp. FSL H7-0596]OMC93246.1 3-dehydroquinate synthase [Viridibacillus arenosi]
MNIPVKAKSHAYEVQISANSLTEAVKSFDQQLSKADKIIVFTDENVWKLHSERFTAEFPYPFKVNILAAGEDCKTFESFFAAQSFLLEQKCTRKTFVFAFGGGAVGDLTGFVASTFMRGIPFIQIPTTILAHDSAVGGKTAINHPLGKNMIGAFYQPQGVLYDISYLKTLPEKEVRSGMAEVIKHALISDEKWLAELMSTNSILDFSQADLAMHLEQGIRVKAGIVAEDEEEHSVRKFLNFGHTYGHAIEAASGFGKLAHGEAVMIGMVYALILSERYGTIPATVTRSFIEFAIRNGYSFDAVNQFTFEQLLDYLMKDKKAEYGILQFVLLKKIGEPFVQQISIEECQEIDGLLRVLIKEVLA